MELFLNLVWLLMAATIVILWLGRKARSEPGQLRQLIAIAVLIAVLFPVISMSDDILAVQRAFEADNYLRRDHLIPANSQHVQPSLTAIAAAIFAGLGFGFQRFVAPSLLPVKEPDHPELACIDNRPPPAA